MARYGIVSDIHGNLQALDAALAFLDARGVDRLLCLGDLVGYNADPDRCVQRLAARDALSIAGNHDLIAAGELDFERCSDKAAFALRRTRRMLSAPTRRALLRLPRIRVLEGGIVLVHGSFAEVREYMRDEQMIEENCERLRRVAPDAWLCLFGHTHAPALYMVRGGQARALPVHEDAPLWGGDRVHFINPGSVDAARRGDGHAELAILDDAARTVSFYRVPYDHARAERRAALSGYRMGWADERVYRAARVIRRGRRIALDRVGRALGALRP